MQEPNWKEAGIRINNWLQLRVNDNSSLSPPFRARNARIQRCFLFHWNPMCPIHNGVRQFLTTHKIGYILLIPLHFFSWYVWCIPHFCNSFSFSISFHSFCANVFVHSATNSKLNKNIQSLSFYSFVAFARASASFPSLSNTLIFLSFCAREKSWVIDAKITIDFAISFWPFIWWHLMLSLSPSIHSVKCNRKVLSHVLLYVCVCSCACVSARERKSGKKSGYIAANDLKK